MFMNDTLGDCAIAGSIEEVRLANQLRGVTVNFTDETALQNYEAITGYNPDDPSSDAGTDVHELYAYRNATGIVDADGTYHKIVVYAGLTPGDWDELLIALSLFDMVGIGIQVPDYAQDQFSAGQPWHIEHGFHSIEGGHYIPVVGATDISTGDVYTWGAKQGITAPFYEKYNTVAVVALTRNCSTATPTLTALTSRNCRPICPSSTPARCRPRRQVKMTRPNPLRDELTAEAKAELAAEFAELKRLLQPVGYTPSGFALRLLRNNRQPWSRF
jgi:hypothetical protein